MEAVDLARWSRFAAKGGIGKCTAVHDCVAENADDLMFLKDDEITVLMQLDDPSGVYLGYCEGVIGRFSGSNVRFHSKLKKPVMAKRSSVNAPTAIPNHAKSPTPSYHINSPSPISKSDSPAPRNSSLGRRSLSSDEQVSGSIPAHVTSSIESELSSNTGPSSRRLGKSGVGRASGIGSASLVVAVNDVAKASEGSLVRATEPEAVSAPLTQIKASAASSTATLPDNANTLVVDEPQPLVPAAWAVTPRPTIPGSSSQASPQHNTVLSSHLPATYTSDDPEAPFDNPDNLNEVSPPLVLLFDDQKIAGVNEPRVPDTSTSTAFDESRISLALSDGEVGIGLSLLQDLADRGSDDDWSDSDSDEHDTKQPPVNLQRMSAQPLTQKEGLSNRQSLKARDRHSTLSEGSRYSDETTSDKLGYEDTETGHGTGNDELAASITRTQRVYRDIDSLNLPGQGRITPPLQDELTFPTVAPLSPSRFRFAASSPQKTTEDASLEVDYTFKFPTPPTHTPQLHRASGSTVGSSSMSSINPNVVGSANRNTDTETDVAERTRRPSVAHSTASVSSDWEGSAADIYDDYRYSRYSAGSSTKTRTSFSSSKRASVSSKVLAVTASDWGDTPPFPERLPRADSGVPKTTLHSAGDIQLSSAANQNPSIVNQEERPPVNSRPQNAPSQPQGNVRTRSRSNTTASLNPAPNIGVILPAQPPPAASQKTALADNQQPVQGAIIPATSTRRYLDSTAGSESDGSAYTDSSMGKPSPGIDSSYENSTPPSINNPGNRPFPLNLSSANPVATTKESPNVFLYGQEKHHSHASSNRSPLLHTSWGSPLSSPVPNNLASQFPSTPDQIPNTNAAYFPAEVAQLGRAISGVDSSSTDAAERLRRPQEASQPSLIPTIPRGRIEDGPTAIKSALTVTEDRLHNVSQPTAQDTTPDLPAKPVLGPPNPSSSLEDVNGLPAVNPIPPLTTSSTSSLLAVGMVKSTPEVRQKLPSEDAGSLGPGTVASETQFLTTGSAGSAAAGAHFPQPPSSLPTSFSRPSLSELRGLQPGPEQVHRQSLFLPHPNAPKPPSAQSPGPMYIAQQQPPPPQPHVQQMRGGVLQAIRMALANQGFPTIYGITTEDLSAATGPVLMYFSITPPLAKVPPPGTSSEPAIQTGHLPTTFPVPGHPIRKMLSIASLDTAISTATEDSGASGSLIPRANFFPKVGGIRPRSRSFSGFQSTTAEIPLPIQRSHEDGNRPFEIPSANEVKRSLSPIIASPVTPSPSHSPVGKNMPPKPSPLRVSSPLQQSHNSSTNGRPIKPPSSPLSQLFPVRHAPPSSPTSTSTSSKQHATLKLTTNHSSPSSSTQRPRTTIQGGHPSDVSPQPAPRPSVDTDTISLHSMRSQMTSPQVISGHHDSLRSKLSLPNLRKNPIRHDDASALAPDSPVADGAMLQVQDMDFELVRPNITHLQAARTSEDSNVLGNTRDGSMDGRHDTDGRRTESPMSPIPPYSPITTNDGYTSGSGPWQTPKSAGPQTRIAESESSMDAHRQRELKWMSTLASVSPSQSRKSKKVKKLLLEGVPASVRYLVWSHLTDGKARCVPGVYAQLAGRDKVPILVDVERDIQKCFADHPQLQSISGSALSLMQAYLTMVPDVQYTYGLTSIAGQLLLLAPEEDAFWIFVSVMDTHMRPYFRLATTQIDIDASLFSRSLEANDAIISKKLFTELSISPVTICRPWFTALFIGSLPSNYLNRIWDIFLFEGISFLFRVGLVLISCCRRQILDSTSQVHIINTLLNPPHSLLPSTPEAFVNLALDTKLKDDDIRKQRVKLEAQAKRQTYAPRTVSTPSSISLPRTG